MSALPDSFQAFRIHDDDQGHRSGLETVAPEDLSEGDVTIRVTWSGINYKDALAATGKGKILRRYPLSGGIDVAGIVVESSHDQFQPGDAVRVRKFDREGRLLRIRLDKQQASVDFGTMEVDVALTDLVPGAM